jgi:hypothetical protein
MAPPDNALQAVVPWSFSGEWLTPCGVTDTWVWFDEFRFAEGM